MQSTLLNWALGAIDSKSGFTPPVDMREAISGIRALPPLPGTAARIIELISDPESDVDELVQIIELDPILAAQIIRWASSALYGYRGQITTVRNAIIRVLGFNFVLDMALGLAVMAPLRAPKDGIMGTRMFWIHALASTRLMLRLAKILPAEVDMRPEEIFLVALLHNIGFPLFGHQFPSEFGYLDQLLKVNPSLSLYNMETFTFGVNHAQIGTWLMEAWAMPKVISDIVYHHHNPFYRGEHYRLNVLTYVNDYLLGQIGIGDAVNQTCPDEVWATLGLAPAMGFNVLDELQTEIQIIIDMADDLTGER
ncbi:MAG: HDOD domain-containing protein [Methylomonas sp.]|nr:HDOD domain-containing protein [Methylomonas sp.]